MAIRVPRGYARNRPYFREVCEGGRPNIGAQAKLPFTGLPHVRVDEVHHDPIVLDPGTIVGVITGNYIGSGTLVPAMLNTGIVTGTAFGKLKIAGSSEASTWGMTTTTSGDILVGLVKPLGVVFAPVYSAYLTTAFTNYKRQHSVAFLTDYVIQIPATNDEEVLINAGDVVIVGSGAHYGIGWSTPYSAHKMAGRYAKYSTTPPYDVASAERIVGRCLKKTLLGVGGSSTSTGDLLNDSLTDFTAAPEMGLEFAGLDMVETLPGLGLSGSATKGIPAFLLGARCDAEKKYWALTILIRL